MLKSMRKSKNCYFYHILVSPGDAPSAITLNIVSMEREFDAYKLSCCMCPSNYNRLRYSEILVENRQTFFIPPLHSMPPLGGSRWNSAIPFGMEKLEWLGYHMMKNFLQISLFVLAQLTNVTDGRTDRRT